MRKGDRVQVLLHGIVPCLGTLDGVEGIDEYPYIYVVNVDGIGRLNFRAEHVEVLP